MILEALVIGALASVTGLFLGLGLAKGLSSIFAAIGFDIPQAGIVFAPRTIVVSLLAGILITLVAGPRPGDARHAGPADRGGARGRDAAAVPLLPLRAASPGLTTAVGIALLVYGMLVDDLGTAERLTSLGVGCLVLFVGVAGLSSRLVKPLARVLGWPGRADRRGGRPPRPRELDAQPASHGLDRGRAHDRARADHVRRRARARACARRSTTRSTSQVSADYVVVSDDNFTPFQPASDEALAAVSGRRGRRRSRRARPCERQRGERHRRRSRSDRRRSTTSTGSRARTPSSAELGDDGALVEQSFAEDKQLDVWTAWSIVETPNGTSLNVRVKGIYEAPAFWEMLGDITHLAGRPSTRASRIRATSTRSSPVPGGVTPENEQALEAALEPLPGVKLDTKDGFSDAQQESLNPLLNLLYVLLALSVIVSLFGIVNTLVLSVFERTRELGMLRAVGMTRRQVRRMIRHESIITALIGTALGMALGILLAVARDPGAGRRGARLLGARREPDRVRDRRDHRRHAGGHLPGAPRRPAERAGGVAIRIGAPVGAPTAYVGAGSHPTDGPPGRPRDV